MDFFKLMLPCLHYYTCYLVLTVELPPSTLISAFTESLNSHKACKVKVALSTPEDDYSIELRDCLIFNYKSVWLQGDSNSISTILNQIAKYEFHIKPMATLYATNSGIPQHG